MTQVEAPSQCQATAQLKDTFCDIALNILTPRYYYPYHYETLSTSIITSQRRREAIAKYCQIDTRGLSQYEDVLPV